MTHNVLRQHVKAALPDRWHLLPSRHDSVDPLDGSQDIYITEGVSRLKITFRSELTAYDVPMHVNRCIEYAQDALHARAGYLGTS